MFENGKKLFKCLQIVAVFANRQCLRSRISGILGLEAKNMARTIVIGDIHGCFDELNLLFQTLVLQASDRVVAVGDLITKGTKNKEVLDLFMTDSRLSSVLGNHDLALLRFWRGERKTLKSSQQLVYNELKAHEKRYSDYLGSLPFMIDLGTHLVVHAGVRPGIALEEQSQDDLTELRTLGADRTSREGLPWYEVYDSNKVVLFGHWPAAEPRRASHAIGLDTGCVYGNHLTAYIIESDEFISVPAYRAYDLPNSQAR